jgi:hypothetical protein
MNSESSRSHSLFILSVTTKTSDGSNKTGKLYMVDLAGSEKVIFFYSYFFLTSRYRLKKRELLERL